MINMHSARRAIRIATEAGWAKPDGPGGGDKSDSLPQILHGLDCGRVLKAVDLVPQPDRSWLLIAYAAHGWAGEAEAFRLQEALVDEYHARRKVREKGKIANMAIVAVHDMQRRSLKQPALSPVEVCRKIRVDPKNWSKSWSDSWHVMGQILNEMDGRGLTIVKTHLNRWIEAKRRENERAA